MRDLFVTSSITVLQVFLWEKLNVYDQIVIKNLKTRNDGYQQNFYINFHLKDCLRMELMVYLTKKCIICIKLYELAYIAQQGSRTIIDVRN